MTEIKITFKDKKHRFLTSYKTCAKYFPLLSSSTINFILMIILQIICTVYNVLSKQLNCINGLWFQKNYIDMIAIRMYAQSRTLLWHELKFYLNIDFSVQGIHTFLVDGRTPSLRVDITATVVVGDVHARRQQRELKLIVLDAGAVPVQQHASNSGSASTWAEIQNIASNFWKLVNEFHY